MHRGIFSRMKSSPVKACHVAQFVVKHVAKIRQSIEIDKRNELPKLPSIFWPHNLLVRLFL